jgi:hypothetical protein
MFQRIAAAHHALGVVEADLFRELQALQCAELLESVVHFHGIARNSQAISRACYATARGESREDEEMRWMQWSRPRG